MYTSADYSADKREMYETLAAQIAALTEGERSAVANLANASALLADALERINWVGFYLMREGELLLGPFQGKPACIRIPVGKGVCGTAAYARRTQLVPDVHAFPGHIACDSASASEIVVPLFDRGAVVGVLDIDSPEKARFDEEDRAGLEAFALVLEAACDWAEIGARRLRLVAPGPEHEAQVLAYRTAFERAGDHPYGSNGLHNFVDFGDWLAAVRADSREETVAPGRVPGAQFLALSERDGSLVGMVNVRRRLNERLLQYAGHIGYSVRPDLRRRGYGAELLALGLEEARKMGLERVLVTCDRDNPASARTILRNGGALENEVPDGGTVIQRYWIDLR